MNFLFTQTPLAFFVQNLWRDEAFSYVMSMQNIWKIVEKSALDFSPPLYYLILHFWMKIFGTSEIAMRSLSLLFFVLTIYILYDIMTIVFKIPVKRAVIYAFFILINPVLLFYAFEARMYMMAAFFISLSYFALWTKKKNLYVAAITMALYSHYFTIFILLGQILTKFVEIDRGSWRLIFTKFKKSVSTSLNKSQPISIINIYKSQQISILLPVLLFLPWLVYLLFKHDFSDPGFWVVRPYLSDIRFLFFVLYTGYEKVFGEYYHHGPGYITLHTMINISLATIIFIPIIFYKIKKIKIPNKKMRIDLLFWSFGPPILLFILSFIGNPLYHPRYFMFSTAGFLLLIIFSLETIFSIVSKKHYFPKLNFLTTSYLLLATFSIILLYLTCSYNTLNLTYHKKRYVQAMYEEISLSAKPKDVIYLTNELDYHLALYYSKTANIYIFQKTYIEIPSYVGKALIPKSAFTDSFPNFPSKAFIVGYNSYETYSQI